MLLVKYFAMCVANALVGSSQVDPRGHAEALAAVPATGARTSSARSHVGVRVGVVRRRGAEDVERGVERGVGARARTTRRGSRPPSRPGRRRSRR